MVIAFSKMVHMIDDVHVRKNRDSKPINIFLFLNAIYVNPDLSWVGMNLDVGFSFVFLVHYFFWLLNSSYRVVNLAVSDEFQQKCNLFVWMEVESKSVWVSSSCDHRIFKGLLDINKKEKLLGNYIYQLGTSIQLIGRQVKFP